jgi:hypothetical protein
LEDLKARTARRWREYPGNELAERAAVFLMQWRVTRNAGIFSMRTYACDNDARRSISVRHTDDARQSRLRERNNEDPATNQRRNASDH